MHDLLTRIDNALLAAGGDAALVLAGAVGEDCEAIAAEGSDGVSVVGGRINYRGVAIQRREGAPSMVRVTF